MDHTQLTLTERLGRVEDAVFGDSPAAPSNAEPDYREYSAIERQRRGEDLAPKVPFTAFHEIADRIQKATHRVHKSATTLEEIGARIMGQLPASDTDQTGVRIEPDGTLDHALLALNRLDESLARLEAAYLRLEML